MPITPTRTAVPDHLPADLTSPMDPTWPAGLTPAVDDDPRWAGTPLATPHWLEGPSGFPTGSVAETGLGSTSDVLAAIRRQTLTRRQIDEVTAFAELLAGRALPQADREELVDDIVDAFEDSPVSATNFLRPLSGAVRLMAAMGPVERCARRLQALTTTWTIEQRRVADGAELNPVMDVVSRHNPLVRHWATSGVVLVADALTSRVEQHHLVLALIGAQPEPRGALTDRLLGQLDEATSIEVAELAASQLRLLCTRSWLRDMGQKALLRLRDELERTVPSSLDVDIVVQQVGYRASMAVASTLSAVTTAKATEGRAQHRTARGTQA